MEAVNFNRSEWARRFNIWSISAAITCAFLLEGWISVALHSALAGAAIANTMAILSIAKIKQETKDNPLLALQLKSQGINHRMMMNFLMLETVLGAMLGLMWGTLAGGIMYLLN